MLAAAVRQWPRYGRAFDDVVFHLSIGGALSEAEVRSFAELLPISATAAEVTSTGGCRR